MDRLRIMAGRVASARAGVLAARDGARLSRLILRQLGPLSLGLLCLWLLKDRLAGIDPGAVGAALAQVGPWQWLAGLAATGVSFAAVGQYDAVLHRLLGTGTPPARAARAGMAAIAISQTVGLGLVTGSLIRWRFLPGQTFAGAARLTLAVTGSFLAGWAVVTALAVLIGPGATLPDIARPVAALALVLAGAGAALCLIAPTTPVLGHAVPWPPLPALARILALTAIDTCAAAAALYVFLPDGAAPGLAAFLPAFLLALGAGLVLGTPGGVGPFEMALAALLPAVGAGELAAAVVCYRAVYFALPAALGGIAFLIGPAADHPAVPGPRVLPPGRTGPETAAALAAATRAEALLHRQGCHALFWDGARGDGWLAGRAGPVLTTLFDPLGGARALPRLLPGFAGTARAAGLVPCLYKIGPRSAALARRTGWTCHPVAEELWLCPADYTTAGPARATLRRKLRHAAQAGVNATGHAPGGGPLPWEELAGIARRWRARRGGERGFSMGRFDPGYLAGQRLCLAWSGGRVVGFVSFHDGAREWTLDLVRIDDAAPDGTAALLIDQTLTEARAAGVPRLSLAAVPLPSLGLSGPPAWLAARLTGRAAGLARFKALFAPRRTRLYLAAPSRTGLGLAALSLALRIRWPPAPPRTVPGGRPAAQDHHDKLAFDNPPSAWQREGN